MKKEIREVNQEKGIVRITCSDERWYARPSTDAMTGLPVYDFVPSVTWICDHYPKGVGFYKWLAQTGWDESQALKEAAGDKGSKIHAAIADELAGKPLTIDAPYLNPSSGLLEPLSLDEWYALMTFTAWYQTTQPTTVASEITVWNDTEHYAGTVDYCYTLPGDPALYLLDFKSSKAVWPSHRLQVSAYAHTTEIEALRVARCKDRIALGILQVGYARTKLGYKFTEIEDAYPLFLATKTIWAEETRGQQPAQKDYPLSLTLAPPRPEQALAAGQGATLEVGDESVSGRQVDGAVRKSRSR